MKAPKINVLAFTDPYCSWCWATEPMILSMMEKYHDQIHFEYVFGGLIKDMTEFYDASNDIGTFAAVVPHWKMVSERSGQPIDENLWVDLEAYPHFSTWPANIAAKAAFFAKSGSGRALLAPFASRRPHRTPHHIARRGVSALGSRNRRIGL